MFCIIQRWEQNLPHCSSFFTFCQ
uniref:Uncharacterized protein n=1 Tax=Anguilla anguilla TaxID=7936 RepID=A0A0E9WA25_ANGAN